MTDLLVRLFIKDSENISDPKVRQRYGLLGSATGIAANFLLFAAKLFAGLITGSIAITADAFNNLSDAGSSAVTLIGFKLAIHKPDREHPFGHGRIEYLSGLLVSMAILLMGVELLKSSIKQIFSPEPVMFSILSSVILAISIAVKLMMCLFNRSLAKRINSSAMKATSADSLGDAIATSAVLAGSLIAKLTSVDIDGYLGLIVAFVILYAGYNAAKDTVTPLLGAKPDPEFVNDISKTVMCHSEVIGMHDLIIHDYGPGRLMISLHAEVNSNGDILVLHDAIDNIERELSKKFGCDVVIHMDPIDCDDAKTTHLRYQVSQLAAAIDPGMTIHDLRAVTGPTHTNLIFDVLLPMDSRLTPKEAKAAMEKAITVLDGPYFAVITVDRPYV
ncbi:MAG: cation diffusion facilitator family transporter [Clostridiaceae bacterium]|nr:cation diffusion facilitator family transporter [Clostridiaceae bacterium]